MDLLCDEGSPVQVTSTDYFIDEDHMLELFRKSDVEGKRGIIRYLDSSKFVKRLMKPANTEETAT